MCTDGSRFAEEGIEQAGYILRHTKPEIVVLRVIPNVAEEYKEYNEYYELFKEEIHKLRKLGIPKAVLSSLEDAKKILENLGLKAEVKVRKGKAGEEILKEAEEGNYNLIVVSSYGKGMSKFLLGSISREVVHRSKVPVLVMKPAQIDI